MKVASGHTVQPGECAVVQGQPSLLSAAEAWALVQAAAEDIRRPAAERRLKHINVRLFLDGCRVDRDLADLLPSADDQDVEAYARRLDETTHRRFFLVINHVQTMDWIMFERVRERATHLAAGYGERAVRAALLVGNDRFSGFGVHFDEGCLQQVQDVIVGRKRAYLWERDALPTEVWARVTNTTRIEHLDAAAVLEAGPGEAISWPGSCYHLMENLDGCSVGVTVTYRQNHRVDLQQELHATLTETASALAQRHAVHLPGIEPLQQGLLADLARALGEPLRGRLIATRLCAETAGCVEHAPSPRSAAAYTADDWLVRNPASPIRWVTRDASVLFSSCGHFYSIEDAPSWLPAFLDAVADTTYASVRELATAAHVPDGELGVVLQVADALRACNALV